MRSVSCPRGLLCSSQLALTRSLRVLDPEHCVCIAETSQSAPLIDQANLKMDRFTNG